MPITKHLLVSILTSVAVFSAAPASAQDASASKPTPSATGGYPAVPLLSTGKTVVGEIIQYPKGRANVTASIFTLEPGNKSMLHKHGVPLFAYILEGELTVDYGKLGKKTYKQGDALMEAMNVAHFSTNEGKVPVKLLAVYMGSSRNKDVIPVKPAR